MKVALLSTNDYGGAARAALRLGQALRQRDIAADLFVKYKKTNLEYVKQINAPEINNLLIENIAQENFYSNIFQGSTMLSFMYPSLNFDFRELLYDYDLVNLHWIASFVSLEAIADLDYVKKPLVWTLHDQNPMTGACHYVHGCDRYLVDCNKCPQMKSNTLNLPRVLLEAKVKYMPKDLVVVTPSKWLAECATKSAVFKNNRVEVIPNSVELDVFRPYGKKQAKQTFNFSEDTKVILFGAENHGERRKGFLELLAAMNDLKERSELKESIGKQKIAILTFGQESEDLRKLDIPYVAMGFIDNDERLALAYSAADVVALPSLEDNLPNIILESFACGTPVVAFDFGGMPDFILNGETGYIVPLKDTGLFAEKLAEVLFVRSLGDNCRRCAEEFFAQSRQAASYGELFFDLIKQTKFTQKDIPPVTTIFPEVGSALAELLCKSSIISQQRMNELEKEKNLLQETLNRITIEKAGMQEWLDKLVSERDLLINERKSSIALQERINKIEEEKNLLQKTLNRITIKKARMHEWLKNERKKMFTISWWIKALKRKIESVRKR